MAESKHCDFFLLRYVPDVVKQEFVNIGVVLLEEGGDGFTGVRFTRDWRRVRCADPEVDVELLEAYEVEFRRLLQSRVPEIINYRGPMSRREWLLALMEQSFSGALELAPMKAVETESPAAEMGVLAQAYLESAARGHRAQSGRRFVYNAMRTAFEASGVWQFMRQDVPVGRYVKGDPLKIDCGYRPNGVVHFYHALSLATNVDAAKLLAFSYGQMIAPFTKAEHATCDLTVVAEDGLDFSDQRVAFAQAALETSGIVISALSEMPQVAERVRIELKL